MKVSIKMIPLGLASLAWIVSIYSGLTLMKTLLHHTYLNLELLEHKEKAGDKIESLDEFVNKAIQLQKRAILLGDIREYSFYIGMAAFVIWRTIDMI